MKGIIFSKPMFRATIEGRNTQTRRIVKPQPVAFQGMYQEVPCKYNGKEWGTGLSPIKPRYKIGEKVYLKEPYNDEACDHRILYKYANDAQDAITSFWKNPLTMPSEYARYFIEITEVRCERVQDISDGDCEKEGVVAVLDNNVDWIIGWRSSQSDGIIYESRKSSYASLFDKINGKGSWNSNPYVWVYSYKPVK